MMVPCSFFAALIIAALICTSDSAALSYQYVNFIRDGSATSLRPPITAERTIKTVTRRPNRSFEISRNRFQSTQPQDFWRDDDEFLTPVVHDTISFEQNGNYITPDFSDGLAYPDPYLLRGAAAKRAVEILYRKPLFFSDINHSKSVQNNQEKRRQNGLSGHKIGTLRSGFLRYRY